MHWLWECGVLDNGVVVIILMGLIRIHGGFPSSFSFCILTAKLGEKKRKKIKEGKGRKRENRKGKKRRKIEGKKRKGKNSPVKVSRSKVKQIKN